MSRSNLQIKVGTYTGTGVAQTITGIGFNPDLVIVKGGANDAIIRTKLMTRLNSSYLSRATADVTTGIIQMTSDGFMVSTGVTANENTTVYYYIAIRGISAQDYFRIGKYIGDGADNRNYTVGGLNFTPNSVFIKQVNTGAGFYKTSDMSGENSMRIDASAGVATNIIQNLQLNGFQLGSSTGVNASTIQAFFWALKSYPGIIKTFTYTGNGADSRSITGIGFQPDFVLVSANGLFDSMIRTSSMSGDTSGFSRNTAFAANHIQLLETDGFQIGSSDNVNKNEVTYYGIALKSGNFNVPLSRVTV